ncbi:MAG: glutaredoxin [Eubacteriales bacterium]|nr:glutaredoxin [Eubacteriales bacterium]
MKEVLSQNGVKYLYVDICESVGKLKLFLTLRDTSPVLEGVRKEHRAGIPCLVIDDKVFLPDGPEMVQHLIDEYQLA